MSLKSKFFTKSAENAFFKFNDLETFTKMIDKAIEADGKDSKAHILKVSIFLRKGDVLKVLGALKYAMQVNPEKIEEYNDFLDMTMKFVKEAEKQNDNC